MPDHNEFGPLPQVDRKNEIKRKSISRLQALLPEEMLIFRQEESEDFGVDGTLELVAAGGVTNFRAQAQLKATEHPRKNVDGSLSLSVDAANLNYLLNGACPVYFLYVVPTEEMYLAWARAEKKRLDEENPNWLGQETITLRFVRQVDPSAINEICERIREEASLRRRVSDALGRNTNNSGVFLGVEGGNVTFTDVSKTAEQLAGSGFAWVTAGFASQVAHQLDRLGGIATGNGKLALLRAYASYKLGNYLEAESWIARAKLRSEIIETQDKGFLLLLSRILDFHFGRISRDDYLMVESELARSEGGAAYQIYELNRLRWQVLEETDRQKREDLLRQFLASAKHAADAVRMGVLRVEIEIRIAEAEGWERIGAFASKAMSIRAQAKLPPSLRDPKAREALFAELALWKEWESRIALQVSSNIDHLGPLLMADALYVRASIRAQMLHMQALIAVVDGVNFQAEDPVVSATADLAHAAKKLYSQCEAWEGESKSLLMIAEMEILRGNIDAARQLARSVLPKVQALRYVQIEQRAQALIEGRTQLKDLEENWERITTRDPDFEVAKWSDTDVRRYAAGAVHLLALPPDRLANAEKDYLAMRVEARERVNWCRHLRIKQDLGHTNSRASFYAEDPSRICVCLRLHHCSQLEAKEPEILISAFKRAWCSGCAYRDPKAAITSRGSPD